MHLSTALAAWAECDRVEAILAERLGAAGHPTMRPRWVRLLHLIGQHPGWHVGKLQAQGPYKNLSYDMAKLEALDLVTSGHHSHDNRIKTYRLTEQGKALVIACDGGRRA